MSTLQRHHEVLTAVWLAGSWHAIYPTATTTLCLRHCTGKGTYEAFPTCKICVDVSRRMHVIDRSCPSSWKRIIEEAWVDRRAR